MAVKKGSFVGRTRAQKNFSYCSLLLQIGTIMATVRDSCHYSNDLLQYGLKDRLLDFFIIIWSFLLLKLVL